MITTIIFTHGGGRFANQLMLFGHFIGLLEEHPELRLINMSFWRYFELCRHRKQRDVRVSPEARTEGEWLPRTIRKWAPSCPRK